MNEEEIQAIVERANKFGVEAYANPKLNKLRVNSYVQGALDQDPISRKAERSDIIQAIDEAGQQVWTRKEILKFIKALP